MPSTAVPTASSEPRGRPNMKKVILWAKQAYRPQ